MRRIVFNSPWQTDQRPAGEWAAVLLTIRYDLWMTYVSKELHCLLGCVLAFYLFCLGKSISLRRAKSKKPPTP